MSPVSCTDLGHNLFLIDAGMSGQPQRLSCYLFDTPERVLVDCGPSNSIHHLFAALDELGIRTVSALAVTHIHLDHAGGAGHFADRYPDARVAVHPLGATHLADPTRLMASATRAFGEQAMRDHWGSMRPVDPARLLPLAEGDRIPLGGGRALEVMHTPGHARHHVAFVEAASGACLVGDAAGLAFPPSHAVQPATPPPDFDPVATIASLRRVGARRPALLGLAHFGPHPDPQDALAAAQARVAEWVDWFEHAGQGPEPVARFRRWVLDEHRRRGLHEEEVARYDSFTFWDTQVDGIRHWLARRGPAA